MDSRRLQLLIIMLLTPTPALAQVERVWLTHRSNQPDKIVVSWMTKEAGDSVVRFGASKEYSHEVTVPGSRTLHRVEIPISETITTYHYSVSTGDQASPDAMFKGYPSDVLRVAVDKVGDAEMRNRTVL